MRGNRAPGLFEPGRRRSIPAYAGEPSSAMSTARRTEVYPRVCGGTRIVGPLAGRAGGLSPRMRGNREVNYPPPYREGSIPAYAGEPRGKLSSTVPGGSIPAYAGEPGLHFSAGSGWQVYPRVCGGTRRRRVCRAVRKGLSPRMRGNRLSNLGLRIPQLSIPAYAGEPQWHWQAGGYLSGLSPRMRGNRCRVPSRKVPAGSIPAYAGEPVSRCFISLAVTVYPRVCGGTQQMQKG